MNRCVYGIFLQFGMINEGSSRDSEEGTKMDTPEERRINKILRKSIHEFGLDLQGLSVFTEAASGPYLYGPIMASLGGAHKVYAITFDSRFGTKEYVKEQTQQAAFRFGVGHRLEVIFEKTKEKVHDCDIFTNSGFVRPFTREMISWMKATAVIPLMWETWEFRDGDIDLKACKEHEILVMGTDESRSPHSMYPYAGYVAMKLLFELGLEGYKTKTLLLGGGLGFGKTIYDHFNQLDMEITWFSDSDLESLPYKTLREHFLLYGHEYDAILLAEHQSNVCLLGDEGLLSIESVKQINPSLCIGIIAGNLDIEGLRRSGIRFFPEEIRPFGYMSYQPYFLGPRPVLELYAAGLKVGEAMARARQSGLAIEEAAAYALKHSPAMDFTGSHAWLRSKR